MLEVREAAEMLRSYENILILTHCRPDGDTVGSGAGLCAGLRALGKTAYLLPNPELTESTGPYAAPYLAPEGFEPERVVAVDIASLSLLPENAWGYRGRIDLAIDHHPSHEGFARAALVRPGAAAAGEIIYDILCCWGRVTAEMALPLYVALATDTGCFVYGNTTAYTHLVAAALMRTGIDFGRVNKTFFRTKSRKRLRLEAAMLEGMEFFDRGRVVVLGVPLSLLERVGASRYDAEDLAALGGQIEGTDCAATLREQTPGVWKVSLRTGARVDANRACGTLGGGGHAAAAGCVVEGSYQEAKEKVLEAVASVTGDFEK